jgi:hypothetical protein
MRSKLWISLDAMMLSGGSARGDRNARNRGFNAASMVRFRDWNQMCSARVVPTNKQRNNRGNKQMGRYLLLLLLGVPLPILVLIWLLGGLN